MSPLSSQENSTKSLTSRIITDQWKHRYKPYAVFDADGTLWRGDISESLLAKMAGEGKISPDSLPDCLKLIPFFPGEGLYSYYLRLCRIDKKIGYVWIAMVFSGFSPEDLKRQVDDLMALDRPVPVRIFSESTIKESELMAPKVLGQQKQLVAALREKGIEVYVVTAALETLSRMVASDPQYGLELAPNNIIGVNLLLKDTTPQKPQPITPGRGAWETIPSQNLFPFIYPPVSMSSGKECAIKEYIHPIHRPILVAGNSADDLQMLFYCDAEAGGRRLFVTENARRQQEIEKEIGTRTTLQQKCNQLVEADKGWLFLSADELA